MKRFAKISHLILKVVVLVLLPLIAVTLITSNTPLLGGRRSFVVLTGSMEPQIPVGSMIYVAPQGGYHVGEIVTFTRGNISVTHRIVEVQNKNGTTIYKTKGDANGVNDAQQVPASQMIGKVFLAVPYIGKFISFLKTVPGFLLLIVLPTLIFVVFEARSMKSEWERQLEKKILKRLEEVKEEL